MTRLVLRVAAAAAFAGLAGPAVACSVVVSRDYDQAKARANARAWAQRATAIIDAEVIRPHGPNGEPALVRAHRVHRGAQRMEFLVGLGDSCDVALDRVGERLRLVMFGGPDLYVARIGSFDRFVDEWLGSDRRRDWPYAAGAAQTPR